MTACLLYDEMPSSLQTVHRILSTERRKHCSIPSPHAGEIKGQESIISALNTCRSSATGIAHQACEGKLLRDNAFGSCRDCNRGDRLPSTACSRDWEAATLCMPCDLEKHCLHLELGRAEYFAVGFK